MFVHQAARATLFSLLLAPMCVLAQANSHDAAIRGDVQKVLSNKHYQGVKGNVVDGNVTLTGTVALYADLGELDHKIHRIHDVNAVADHVTVAGPTVEDSTLRNKLAEKLTYDRVGYGTTTYNSFTIGVHDGVVTLGGVAYGPQDKSSAISLASNYPGVKDVVDNIEVAPASPMDDRIRIEEARAIYGASQLNRYALDPAKPIRITVINGNVTLTGVVDSKADRDVANIRANSVPGVFKVTNDLQVAGQSSSR
jgi:hyperosmotically inducible protein